MFVSKFWTLLLGLAGGAVLAVILLAKDGVNRERLDNATAIVYKEMTKTDVALKLHARKRLDVLLAPATDPDVRKLLAQASAQPDKVDSIRSQLLSLLRKQNEEMKDDRTDMLIAVDTAGTVICQAGSFELVHGHRLAGFPVVDAALRGYVQDDTWKIGNDVYLVAARPVIEQGRYVGAMIDALRVTDKLASELSPSTQLAFFSGNTVIAVGAPKKEVDRNAQGAVIAGPLESVLKSAQLKDKGYSEIQRLETQDGDFLAVYMRLRGEAAKGNVGFALVTPITEMTTPTEFYEKASAQDVAALPRVWLIGGIAIIVLLGWLWNYIEGQRPLTTLLKAVKELEKSDPKDQLNVYRFRRRVRKVAAAFNAVMDAKLKAMMETAQFGHKNIDSILGSRDDARLSSASFKFVEPAASEVPPPPPAPGEKVKIVTKPQVALPQAPPAPPAARPPVPPPPPPPPAPAAAATAMRPEEENQYFHEIFEEFLGMKKSLGEAVDQLTFERFEVTLKKNRDTLKARYGCNRVKFQVYEKDGKASLKATPVK